MNTEDKPIQVTQTIDSFAAFFLWKALLYLNGSNRDIKNIEYVRITESPQKFFAKIL